jgi:cell fate (sporulation/competence/biofilm development) regulator YlbF (YheA/YmcA/DUF963 family)
MANTQEIIAAAKALGELIAKHETGKKFQQAVNKIQADLESQRILNDFNRMLQKLDEKEQAGQPIEVAEKQQLEKCQQAVFRSATLRDFQMVQMDYLDLMRQVDEAISGAFAPAPVPGATPASGTGSPVIAPGM